MSSRSTTARPFWVIGLLWIGLTALYVVTEARLSGTDVFLFKDAGVNYATTGRFVTSNLPHMPPDQEMVFAYYPPVFPFVFGLWSKAFGVGLKQSILFDQIVKGVRTFILFLFLAPWLVPALKRREQRGVALLVLAGLFVLSLLTTDGDRPDELALCWGLAAWYLLWRGTYRWFGVVLGGVLLGLCGATSPAAGVFFTLGSLFFLWRQPYLLFKVGILGGLAAAIFSLCNLPIHIADPEAFERFSKQLPLSTLPYYIPFTHGHRWIDVQWSLQYPLAHLKSLGVPYFILIGTALLIRLFFWKSFRELEFPTAFGLGAFLFVPICLCIWTLQPFYMWFSGVTLVASTFALALEMRRRPKTAASIVLIQMLALCPFLLREGKLFVHAAERDQGQDVESIRQRVLAYVEPTAKLATTSDQYFTFKNVHNVSDISYVCERLETYDYVYVTGIESTLRTRPHPIPIPCEAKQHCFTIAADLTSNTIVKLFGNETPYYVRDSGGVLYRNSRCKSNSVVKLP